MCNYLECDTDTFTNVFSLYIELIVAELKRLVPVQLETFLYDLSFKHRQLHCSTCIVVFLVLCSVQVLWEGPPVLLPF